MSKLATFLAAAAVLALCFVTFKPSPAEAGRGWGRGGPSVNVYVGPRWGYYRPRYRPYAYGYPYGYYPYWRSHRWSGWY